MIKDLATKIDMKEVAMNKTTSVDDEHSKIFPTLVPETWAVASVLSISMGFLLNIVQFHYLPSAPSY